MDKQKTSKYLEDFLYANVDEIKSLKYRYPQVAKAIVETLIIVDKKYAQGNITEGLKKYIYQ